MWQPPAWVGLCCANVAAQVSLSCQDNKVHTLIGGKMTDHKLLDAAAAAGLSAAGRAASLGE